MLESTLTQTGDVDGEALQPFLEWPVKLTISITHTCHNDCAPCYADCKRGGAKPELSAAQWDDVLDQLIANKMTGVFIEGGEPLLLPGIFEFISRASREMMTWLRTHGDLIDAETADKLKAANVGNVVVDLWGAEKRTHDLLKGREGSFEEAVAGIRHLRRLGIPVIMTLIMNRHNYPELQKYADLAAELGVQAIGILRLYPLGKARRLWSDLALPLDTQMEALRSIQMPDGVRLMQSWHPNNGNCCWQSAALNAYGDSIGCVYLRDFKNFGNVTEQRFVDTWQDPEYEALRSVKVEKICSSCSSTQDSHGGCRSTAYAFHGRWTAPDPYDEELNDGTDLTRLPEWLAEKV